MPLPDISEYYTPERAAHENKQWTLTQGYKKNAAFLLPLIERFKIRSVIEFGSATGHLAGEIPPDVEYLGVEPNDHFRKMAQEKLSEAGTKFVKGDVRTFPNGGVTVPADLSMAWAFLKHFGLPEWDAILTKILSHGKYGCFDVQVADRDIDDGVDFHHVWVTEAHVLGAVEGAGHDLVCFTTNFVWHQHEQLCREVFFFTKRKERCPQKDTTSTSKSAE